MRHPMRFTPHTVFPTVKNVSLVGDHVEGEFDFTKGYDPFEKYQTDPIKAPHMELIRMKPSGEGVLGFVKKWGPPTFGWPHATITTYDEFYLEEYIYRLSHEHFWHVPTPKWPPETHFECLINVFLSLQKEVSHLYLLWDAFRTYNYDRIRSLLNVWPDEVWPRKMANKDPNLAAYAEHVRSVSSRGEPDALLKTAADCIYGAFYEEEAVQRRFEPCLELTTTREGTPVGFGLALHVRDLEDAIRLMLYADMCAGYSYSDCAKCGKPFVAEKRNQRCCSIQCTQALNSQRYYQRKRTAQQRSKRSPKSAE